MSFDLLFACERKRRTLDTSCTSIKSYLFLSVSPLDAICMMFLKSFNVASVLSYRGLVYIVCVVVSDIIQIMDI